MSTRASGILVVSLLSLVLLAGCASGGDPAPVHGKPGRAGATSAASASPDPDGGEADASAALHTVPFPHITSCAQVTAAVPDFVQGMDLVGESVQDSGVLCNWASPDDGPFASAFVTENSMPTKEGAEAMAKMLHLTSTYFTNPQLSARGGAATRWTVDGGPESVGYTTVYVPGVSVELHVGRHGSDGGQSYAPDDTTAISVALAILKI